MSLLQKFFLSVLPSSWAADMQAESQRWFLCCKECGLERTVWEVGGIRWKAAGNPRRYLPCPHCGRNTWHTTVRKQS